MLLGDALLAYRFPDLDQQGVDAGPEFGMLLPALKSHLRNANQGRNLPIWFLVLSDQHGGILSLVGPLER